MSPVFHLHQTPAYACACTRGRIAVMDALIGELRGRLDLQAGGTLAAHYDDLYDYMGRRLQAARLEGSSEILDAVADLLREVRLAASLIPPHARGQRVAAPAIRG